VTAYKLAFTSEEKNFADPRICHFIPADEIALSGKDYTRRIRRQGIGVAVLAERESPPGKRSKGVPNPGKDLLRLDCRARI